MPKKDERKLVELGRKRIPLRKLIHGKEIREAAKALEDCRLQFKEEEFFQRARLSLKWETGGDCLLIAQRPETDNEYAARIEAARIAAEQKAERELKRRLQEELRKQEIEKQRKRDAIKTIEGLIQKNGLNNTDLEKLSKLLEKQNLVDKNSDSL